MSIRPHILILALILVAAGTNGCYTMLYHPSVARIDDSTGEEQPVAVDRSERCTDCHTGTMHGSMQRGAMSSAGTSEDWYDYDPFHRNDSYGYYDPFFYGTPLRSPYFYDNYYNYRNYPWWISNRDYDEGGYYGGDSGGSGGGSGSGTSAREKPSRRGGDDTRGYTPLPSTPRSSTNTEKPSSSAPSSGGSSSDDDSKEKPARRGGVK